MTRHAHVAGYAAVVVGLGVAVGVVGARLSAGDPDPAAFMAAGRALLSTGALHVFDSSYLQVGPLYLLLQGVLSHLSGLLSLPALTVASVFWSVLLVAWVARLARELYPGGSEAAAAIPRSLLAAVIAAALPVPLVAITGHFEDLLTCLALLTCSVLVTRRRPTAAALMLVVAVGFKSWGLLGLPLLLLAPSRRARIGSVVGAVTGMAAVYAPFAVGGHLASGSHVWSVAQPSVLSLFIRQGAPFGLTARVAQVVVVLVASSVVAARGRGSEPRHAVAVGVVVVIVAARLLSDPYPQSYYVASLMLAAMLLALTVTDAHGVAAAVAVAVGLDVAFAVQGRAGSWLQLAVGLAAVSMGYGAGAASSWQRGHLGTGQQGTALRIMVLSD